MGTPRRSFPHIVKRASKQHDRQNATTTFAVKMYAMLKQTILRSLIAAAFAFASVAAFAVPSQLATSNFELQTSNSELQTSLEQMVALSAGTVVNVSLNEAIDAETVSVGNSLDFFVRSNVTVNGKVLIAAGATATGWVKSVKKCNNGKSYEITITVENAMAVDGQMVNLRSIPHVINATPNSAKADIGANLSARVLNDTKINA